MAEHICTFAEEMEPSGRLIAVPCLECGKAAFYALREAKRIRQDYGRLRDLVNEVHKIAMNCDQSSSAGYRVIANLTARQEMR